MTLWSAFERQFGGKFSRVACMPCFPSLALAGSPSNSSNTCSACFDHLVNCNNFFGLFALFLSELQCTLKMLNHNGHVNTRL